MELLENTLNEALTSLPDIQRLDFKEHFQGKKYDFLLLALGFETRTKSFVETVVKYDFNCREVIVFNYSTNVNDNIKNKAPIEKALKAEHRGYLNLDCDGNDFIEILRKTVYDKVKQNGDVSIVFDISTCSSKLLLTVLRILFDYNVDLKIVYTEAEVYYPLFEEYIKNPELLKDRNSIGITKGVENVVLSQEYVGDNSDNYPEFVIAFPTFKADRTKTVLIEIDEGIFSELKRRLVWIIGKPNMEFEARTNRIRMMREINDIEESESSPLSYEISTLDYKETLGILERIYQEKSKSYHLNISDLGSKMQSLGIALYCQLRPEISVYFSVPEKYNPGRYSEGVKDHWMVDFGSITKLMKLINSIDTIKIV